MSAYQFYGTSSFIFVAKLRSLKNDLKLWNKQSFGDIDDLKKSLLEELRVIEGSQEGRPLFLDEISRMNEVSSKFDRVILQEIS